jgi:hypothetical protein
MIKENMYINPLSPNVKNLLGEFEQYLVAIQGKDPATADAYIYDVHCYLDFYQGSIDDKIDDFCITDDILPAYKLFLHSKGNTDATIDRRFHGLYSFWRFLYKRHKAQFPNPPVSLDLLDIKIRKRKNPTHPIPVDEYKLFQRSVLDGLSKIY